MLLYRDVTRKESFMNRMGCAMMASSLGGEPVPLTRGRKEAGKMVNVAV